MVLTFWTGAGVGERDEAATTGVKGFATVQVLVLEITPVQVLVLPTFWTGAGVGEPDEEAATTGVLGLTTVQVLVLPPLPTAVQVLVLPPPPFVLGLNSPHPHGSAAKSTSGLHSWSLIPPSCSPRLYSSAQLYRVLGM